MSETDILSMVKTSLVPFQKDSLQQETIKDNFTHWQEIVIVHELHDQ